MAYRIGFEEGWKSTWGRIGDPARQVTGHVNASTVGVLRKQAQGVLRPGSARSRVRQHTFAILATEYNYHLA